MGMGGHKYNHLQQLHNNHCNDDDDNSDNLIALTLILMKVKVILVAAQFIKTTALNFYQCVKTINQL